MKASELIAILAEQISTHGDLPVYSNQKNYSYIVEHDDIQVGVATLEKNALVFGKGHKSIIIG